MIKTILATILFVTLISCKTENNLPKYFGQEEPDTVPIIFAPQRISEAGRLEQGFTISPDYREIHFGVIGMHDSLNCIYVTQIQNNQWSAPIKPGYIGNDSVFFPMYSADGKTLSFTKRVHNSLDTDLWYCQKTDDSWGEAKRFQSYINSKYREGSSSMSINNNLYFTSNRDTMYACCGDIYYAMQFSDTSYGRAQRIANVNSIFDEEGVFISPQEDYILIQSWIVDFQTKHDLYISYRRKDSTWSAKERLDTTINTVDLEQRPFVTRDKKYLFFNRFALDSNFNALESDIYWVNTKKIFKPFVYNPVPDVIIENEVVAEIELPIDYFKDIDDSLLDYTMDFGEVSWLEFDEQNMKLFGKPNQIGDYNVKVIAKDKANNTTEDIISIKVE